MFSTLFFESVSGDHLVGFFLDATAKASVILALAAVVCWSLRRHSAAVRHWVWTMAILGSLLVPALTLTMPRWTLAVLSSGHSDVSASSEVVEEPMASTPHAEPAETPASRSPKIDPNSVEPLLSATGTTGDQLRAGDAAVTSQTHSAAPRIGALVLGVWSAGVAAFAVAFAAAVVMQIWRHRQLQRIEDTGWNECVSRLASSLALRRRVVSYEISELTAPLTSGIFRPIIVVPHNWREWDEGQRRSVLIHELAHVKRFDVALQLLGRLGAIVYWFHPLMWCAIRQLRIERELACDDCVLLAGQRPSDYAAGLLRTLRSCRPQPLAMGVAMAHSARIDERVMAILDPLRSRLPVSTTVAAATLVTTCAFLAGIGGASLAAHPRDSVTSGEANADDERSNTGQQRQVANDRRQVEGKAKQVFKFSGKVRQGDGAVAGATVTLWWRCGDFGFFGWWHPRDEFDYKPRFAAVSGEDGEFEFTFSPSELTEDPHHIFPEAWRHVQVVVSKEGMGVGSCDLASLQAGKEIWIQGTVPVRGRVIDLEGQPVAGATIRFHHMIDDPVRLWQTTWKSLSPNVKTDEDGKFVIHGLP
ncbi:MAG: hypothetical protein IAG10_11270 [Planctomycetaceae bacterium]|nr:hypothetical protein [Planctomycetaceae bacterium]